MQQLKKTLLTLVALLAVTTGAWAKTDPNSVYWDNQTWSGWAENVTTHTVGDITITCSGNAKAYESTTSGEPLALQAGANDAITFTSNGKPFASVAIMTDDELNVAGWTYNSSTWSYEWSGEPTTSVTLSGCDIKADVITFTFAAAEAPTTVEWNATTKTGTFTQPAGNVTVSVEYYDLATLADKGLTAAEDAAAKTEAPLAVLADGAVTGGTLMYYVATDADFSQADAIALAEDAWKAAIPTAETIDAAGTCYVWYYIKGDAEHSDTDPQRLAVTVLPAPTYAVTFAEGTPEPDKWTATPNTDVKKGDKVTVTYTGERKVIGVKAEKKAVLKTLTVTGVATKSISYAEGDSWQQAIERPENAGSGWSVQGSYVFNGGNTLFIDRGNAYVRPGHTIDATLDYSLQAD